MTQAVQSTPDYTMGFSDEILGMLGRFSAQTSATHLLPRLRPGMRVLDFGCGPGSISVGLAKAVDPGVLHGVDMEPSQIELARRIAESEGCHNAVFSVGDVTQLDFDDGFFDVAHCHNLLMHVPDTKAVLAEVERVLKPGGLISSREMNCQSCFTNPDFGVIRRAWEMFEDLLAADDGHPQMGKDLKLHLAAAGFESIEIDASFDVYSSPEDVAFIYEMAQQWFLAPEITEAAIKYGAATEKLCGHIATAYERWRDHPGAVAGIAFGEALARKPLT